MPRRPVNPTTLAVDGVHRQGSLDGLCGIYCVINSISLQLGNKVDSADLFASIVKTTGDQLSYVILEGMMPDELEKHVLKSCQSYLEKQNITLTYKTTTATKLGDFWAQMQEHYSEHGDGSILLSISGCYEHWTCVRQITQRCIILADSGHLNRLYRSRVTVGSPNKQRLHTLTPIETFLISIS